MALQLFNNSIRVIELRGRDQLWVGNFKDIYPDVL